MDREFLNQVKLKFKDKVSVSAPDSSQVRYRYPSRLLRVFYVIIVTFAILTALKFGCEVFYAMEREESYKPLKVIIEEFTKEMKE